MSRNNMFAKCPKCQSDKLDYNVESIGWTDYWYCENCDTYLSWHDYSP